MGCQWHPFWGKLCLVYQLWRIHSVLLPEVQSGWSIETPWGKSRSMYLCLIWVRLPQIHQCLTEKSELWEIPISMLFLYSDSNWAEISQQFTQGLLNSSTGNVIQTPGQKMSKIHQCQLPVAKYQLLAFFDNSPTSELLTSECFIAILFVNTNF